MNHNTLIWLLSHFHIKLTPVDWAERCRLVGIDWRVWDKVTTIPSEAYCDLEQFARNYQRFNASNLLRV